VLGIQAKVKLSGINSKATELFCIFFIIWKLSFSTIFP